VPRAFPVVLSGFTAFLGLYATQPLLPYLSRVFGASEFEASLTVVAPTTAVAIAAPFVGRLADRYGLRQVILLSAFGLAIAALGASTAATLTQLIAWRFVQGLVTPGVFAVVIAYIHQEWPETQASGVTAAYVGGTVFGGFTGRMLTGVVSATAGWPRAFVLLGLLHLAIALVLARLMPAERTRGPRVAQDVGGSVSALLKNRQIAATYIVGSAILCTQMAAFTYVTFHLAAPPYRLSTSALGWLFATYLLGAVVTPVAGRWIDRFGRRTSFLVAGGMGVGAALLTLVPSLAAIMLGLALLGTSVFVTQATASSHVAAEAPDSRGLALGMYSTCYYAGGSFGGAAPSYVWARAGWPGCVAFVIAVQCVMLLIVFSTWQETGGQAAEVLTEV
jgi:MFS transporter, YNFM family, putative membrane transport protein